MNNPLDTTVVPPFNLTPEDSRLTTHPIPDNRLALWAYYENARDSFWAPNEVALTKDAEHWETRLDQGQKHLVKYLLAFFAASDGIINLNLIERFSKEVPMLEANYFYRTQAAIEDIHATMYSLQLTAIIPDRREKEHLLNAIQTIPTIKRMAEFMTNCIKSDETLGERLLRMACVEGIFFTGCFCVIYWLQTLGLMPGLAHANELIARDEAQHTLFAMHLYTMLNAPHKATNKKIDSIFREAVQLAKDFITDALPSGLSGMSAELMSNYIENQADNLLTLIDYEPIYGTKHEFHFMEQINVQNRTNFFERRVSEYSKPREAENTDYAINYDV